MPTTFEKYAEYVFDDPARDFEAAEQELFEGTLDRAGHGPTCGARSRSRAPRRASCGAVPREGLRAERRVQHRVVPAGPDPYDRYVGIRVPKGDELRGMLLTDTDHAVRIVLVDPEGNPVGRGQVQAEIYKIDWRWWWEKGDEDLAEFASSPSTRRSKSDR